jgi:hypothetical protein
MTRILEVEADGTLTLPPDVLGNARPHSRYVLETQGERLTLRPETTTPDKPETSPKPKTKRERSIERWEKERQKLAEELGKVWPEGVSAVDVISEMRR